MTANAGLRPHRAAVVIGAGPSGASAAILLARSGWSVTLIEQHAFPRQKVCGECVAAGNIAILEELGVAQAFRRLAGAELTRVGWMRGDAAVIADMPPCSEGAARYGRALGRDVFDVMLLERARAVGVRILQPAKVRAVSGTAGRFECEIEYLGEPRAAEGPARRDIVRGSIVIDAHGSWETGPRFDNPDQSVCRLPHRPEDLFAFKASFTDSRLPPGLLPVVSVNGGYGGLVVANDRRTTVALCLRRDTLRALRSHGGHASAGAAVENYLRSSCRGIEHALQDTAPEAPWLTVGPLRPGVRLREQPGIFAVGNAAGETHPLIGEGITMALQSSRLLADALLMHVARSVSAASLSATHRSYASAWRKAFLPRLRLAAVYAQVAMHAPLAGTATAGLRAWPALLTSAARMAGKARRAVDPLIMHEETP